MYYRLFLWLLMNLICFSKVCADDGPPDPFVSSLTNTQNLLPTVIRSVSAISGEWLESETDFIVNSSEPLALTRFYSASYSSGLLGYNWEFNRPHYLNVDSGKDYVKARLNHPSGISTIHRSKKMGAVAHMPIVETRSLTNCLSYEMSGKTNLHNVVLNIYSNEGFAEVVTGNGHVTRYKRYHGHRYIFFPEYERKANGNLILFHNANLLTSLEACTSKKEQQFGEIKFERHGQERLEVTASDGKHATYKFSTFKYQQGPTKSVLESGITVPYGRSEITKYCLIKAKYSHKPWIEYEYLHPSFEEPIEYPPNPLLKKKIRPNGRFQEVTYYDIGIHQLNGIGDFRISNEDDFRFNRVKAIKAPVGVDATPVVTHRFVYLTDDSTTNSRKRSFSGSTKVYDALMHKTIYTYNKEHRPTSIERYAKDRKTLYSKESFIWNEEDKNKKLFREQQDVFEEKLEEVIPDEEMITDPLMEHEDINSSIRHSFHQNIRKKLAKRFSKRRQSQVGNLLGKYTEGGDGKIHHGLFFEYDPHGNIETERFYGNLSGTCTDSIRFNNHGKISKNGIEYYEKRFTYSNDDFNNLLTEEEDNGKNIEYTYDPEIQQISAKYIKDGNAIKLRQFFFYDQKTAALIKVIKDDGSERDCENLADVKERLITAITLNRTHPLGLPKIIEEKYWDEITGKEKLLKKTECHYEKGYLVRQDISDANNQYCFSLVSEYDDHGNVIKEINAEKDEITKKYDDNDNLELEIGPRLGDTKEYIYDRADRLIKMIHKTVEHEFVTTYEYDLLSNRKASIDHFGNRTEYIYDEFNRLIKTIYPAITITNDRVIEPTSETAYDIHNNPITITQPGGWKTHYTYNSRGKPVTKTYPDGRIEKFEYNLDGSLKVSIAPNGNPTTYTRDFLGRVIEETTFDGEKDIKQTHVYKGLRLVSKTDGEGCKTDYTYDGAGRLTSETCEDNYKTYSYDSLGRISKITQWYSEDPQEVSIQAFKYDFLNRLKEERLENAQGHVLQSVKYEYDKLGNQKEVRRLTDQGEQTTKIEYNGLCQPTKKIDPEGNVTHYEYIYTTKNSLKQSILQIKVTDPKGRITTQTYDALGRLREVKCVDPFSQFQLNQLLSKQESFYDSLGRPVKTIDSVIVNGKAERQFVVGYRYYFNEEEDLIEEGVGTSLSKKTEWKYNPYGQRETLIKPNGTKITHKYDLIGRLQEIFSDDGTIHYVYKYNSRHQVEEVLDKKSNTITKRQYDCSGNLKEETLANDLALLYDYDRLSRLKKLTLPDNSTVHYHYNAAYLRKIERYQNNTLLYQHQNNTHTLSGSLKQSTLIGKGGTLEYAYDPLGRIQEIKGTHWSQHIPKEGFDSVGCLLKATTRDPIGTIEHRFAYNALNHLQKEEGNASHSYLTDSLHNRLEKNKVLCEINAINQLQKYGHCKYIYNRNGNLIEKENQVPKLKTTYQYDAFDRLTSITSPEGVTTYNYDSFNRRISKTHNGVTSRYLYQGQNEIGSLNDHGEITELRILGTGINKETGSAIALELNGKTYAPLHDRQGHVVCLLDAKTGQPVETYRYSAFGEETIYNAQGQKVAHSQVNNPWRFASKRIDPETGWIYFGRRYYDPEIGRWTTPDPIGFTDGPNLYAYLHHSPLTGFDAYGLFGEAYKDSCNVGANSPYYSGISDRYEPMFPLGPDRPEIQPSDSERASYISDAEDRQKTLGILHGSFDFAIDQVFGFARLASPNVPAFQSMLSGLRDETKCYFNDLFTDYLYIDSDNPVYQNNRSNTALALEVASLLIPICDACKALKATELAELALIGEKFGSRLALKEINFIENLGSNNKSEKVIQLTRKISEWLGKEVKMIKNKARDPVFISKDGTKRVRFDFENPAPHSNPHGHVEEFVNGKWGKSGPVYPSDVPHN